MKKKSLLEELEVLFPQRIDELKSIWLTMEWATYFSIQGSCGLRPGEVSALSWGDWHRNLHGLVISHSIENRSGRRKETKKRIKKPAVLTERAEGLLLLLESVSNDTDKDSLIFHSPDGGPVILESANKHFKASCKRAGVDPWGRTQYSLRHSFNTHALHMMEKSDVQKLMGHRTDEMTKHYYHPTDEDLIQQIPESVRKGLEDIW